MTREQQILSHTYENGLTLVVEPMPWLESAAFSISVPAGCRFDPADQIGTANLVCEMVQRGCSDMSSRQFIEALEMLGVDFGSSVSLYNTHYNGAMQAAQLPDAIAIFADVLRRPHFPPEQLEDGRLVCLQEVKSLEDDLAQKTIFALRHRFYGDPDGRHCEGTVESISSIQLDDLKRFYQHHYRPNGTIIACAGKIDFEKLKQRIGTLFDDWEPHAEPTVATTPPLHGTHHIPFDSEQTHITVAYPGVAYAHPDYYLNLAAVRALSSGMSSRLFTEVREKRGLCYSVFASCHTLKDRGSVICYSGTSTDRAQKTLDVLIEQLVALKDGIREDELQRVKIQMRSSMVMQQESSQARSRSIAGDWFYLGCVRTVDERTRIINDLSVESINQFLATHPPSHFDVVTLGAQPLEMQQDGVS